MTTLGGQYELLALRGAVLLFAQRLQLSAAVGRSIFLLPLQMSFEEGKA